MITLIAGRTGTGKTALRGILKKDHGWRFVRTCTTRPRRDTESENAYTFLSQAEADKIQDKIAPTRINDCEYFMTPGQLDGADACVIDINGIEALIANLPNQYFQIVYIRPGSESLQRNLSIQRSDDPENEARIFDSRAVSESEQFDRFESRLDEGREIFPGFDNYEVIPFTNTYEEKDIRQLASDLDGRRQFYKNAVIAIQDLMDHGDMRHTDDMQPELISSDGTPHAVPLGFLCSRLRSDMSMLGELMCRWMSLPGAGLTRNEAAT